MPARLTFTESARRDLLQIGAYIGADSPANAARFIAALKEACGRLAANPNLGRPRPELAPEARSFPVRPYIVFYHPMEGGVSILRIIHGARDLGPAFNE